jgi:hypothetical protein
LFNAELRHRELAGIPFLPGSILQQQLEAIAVTLQRVRAQFPLAGQVIGEEAV